MKYRLLSFILVVTVTSFNIIVISTSHVLGQITPYDSPEESSGINLLSNLWSAPLPTTSPQQSSWLIAGGHDAPAS